MRKITITLVCSSFLLAGGLHASEPDPGKITLALASDPSFQHLEDRTVPVVLTATRLLQPQAEVPASMTVIDRKLIEMTGARELPELLRLVPGMSVGNVDGNVPSVSYHATVSVDIKRMQVLVDGRSVYQPGLARVLWDDIPVAVDDIERIEVTRGPNSAAYGPNSFSAIVNIITRHPEDTQWGKVRVTQGNNGISDYYVRGGALVGDASFRVSAYGRGDDGYEINSAGAERRTEKDLQGFAMRSAYQIDPHNLTELHLGYKEGKLQADALDAWETFGTYATHPDTENENYFAMVKWHTDLSENHTLDIKTHAQKSTQDSNWNTCMHSGEYGLETNLLFTREALELREYYRQALKIAENPKADQVSYEAAGELALVVESATEQVVAALGSSPDPATVLAVLQGQAAGLLGHALSAEENALLVRARDIALAPGNGGVIPLLCGEVETRLDEDRVDIEIVDNLVISDRLRFVGGVGWRDDSASSRYYLNGSASNEMYRIFAHMEYRPVDFLLVNIGAHHEHGDTFGNETSPRFALNFLLDEQQSIRLVYSEATHAVDIYGDAAAPRIYLKNLNAPYAGNVSAMLGQPSAVFYMREDLADDALASEKIESSEIGYYGNFANVVEVDLRLFEERLTNLFSDSLSLSDFDPNNHSWVNLRGAESQVKWNATENDLLMVAFAHIDNEASTKTETRFSARNSGYLFYNHHFDFGLNINTAFFMADRYNALNAAGGFHFQRVDGAITQDFRVADTTLRVGGKVMYRLDDDPFVVKDNRYEGRDIYYLTAEVIF
jgi:iron complex outermembrane receptor protein